MLHRIHVSDDGPPVICGDLPTLRCFAGTSVRRVVLSAHPRELAFFSRHCTQRRTIADPRRAPEAAARDLLKIGRLHLTRPVLLYADDAMVLCVSRHRTELVEHFRMPLPPRDVVELLMDRARLAELTERAGLGDACPPSVRAEPPAGYHAYLDARGRILGEVVIGRQAEVVRVGRQTVARLGIVGPVSMSFRPANGHLALVQIRPRFDPASYRSGRGVNLPLIAYRDLTGQSHASAGIGQENAVWEDPARLAAHLFRTARGRWRPFKRTA